MRAQAPEDPCKGMGRFAPSPSGRMHVGNVFSALMAWASARSRGAGFCIRLEDLDERCRNPHNAELLLDDLRWLGLDWDGEVYVQRNRLRAYERAFELIRERAHVYPCFCSRSDLHAASAPHASDGTPVYAGTCRDLTPAQVAERARSREPAWRVEVPHERIEVVDGHLGHYGQDLAVECGDFVLRRSDGVFAYQLVCVVDDADENVTEVVRGSDLLSSVPRQIFLQHLLALPVPRYFHHPLLLAPDGRRLSKREKDCDLGFIRDHVRCPEAVVGLVAWLAGLQEGSSPQEMSARELAGAFSWDKVRSRDIVLDSACLPFG